MKIVLAEVPYTKDRDISIERSCLPEGAELAIAVFDEHAENNDAFYAEIKDADIIIDGYVHFGKKEIDAMDHCKVISFQSTGYNEADLDYAREKGIGPSAPSSTTARRRPPRAPCAHAQPPARHPSV